LFTFHHLGIAVTSLSEAIPFYTDVLGYRLTSGPFEDPIQRVNVCFLARESAGEVIELIAPLAESPIREILRRGGGAYHTCYEVADLDKTLETLCGEHKCLLVSGPVPAAAFGQRRIAWLHTASRHLLELVERAT
jgi:methylmalonyl-CoA/ethylmalonyl-CoA epimerase